MTLPRRHVLLAAMALCGGCFDTTTSASVDEDEGASSDGSTTLADDETSGASEEDGGTGPETSAGPESTGGSSGEPEAESTGGIVDDPPEVIFFEPADGQRHVYDQTVTIAFSEPVVQPSLEAAFPQAEAFEWNDDGTQVQFELVFPFESDPVLHQLVVPTSVVDLAGNEMAEPFESAFELASLEVVTIPFEPDTSTCCTGMWDLLFTGDDATDAIDHAGISIPMTALPASALAIRSATFDAAVLNVVGNGHDPALGSFVVDHVAFGDPDAIDAPTILAEAFADLFEPGGAVEGPVASIDVIEPLTVSWSEGAPYFQLRFRPEASNGDGEVDAIIFSLSDEAQPRVEVEYFE